MSGFDDESLADTHGVLLQRFTSTGQPSKTGYEQCVDSEPSQLVTGRGVVEGATTKQLQGGISLW
jgi:hypothetical protein